MGVAASKYSISSAPTGLVACVSAFPRLTPWANFWRPYGAGEGEVSSDERRSRGWA
jgi:hypothetical protein